MYFKKTTLDWIIVGLGNPGSEYERTRHNVGFRTVDLLAKQAEVKIDRAKFRALTRSANLAGQKVLLLKPETYMNRSGEAVQLAAMFYKVPISHILVLSDDISLPVGKIRVRAEGSAGGHNGLKSIIGQLDSQDFPRVRIGVGAKPHPDYDMKDWVLSTFSAQEEKALAVALDNAAKAALTIVDSGVSEAANRFNGSHP